jgi:hypothetical protein
MRRLFFALISFCLLLFACSDGDIITVELDFGESFETCGELVFYKIKNDPAESLSLFLSGMTEDDLIDFDDELSDVTETLVIANRSLNETTNTFHLRRYGSAITGSELFCNAIPPNIDILSDDMSKEGEVTITTVVIEEDNDGIPWEDEDDNADADNNPATNPTDTDNDGIPNYLDLDDDGDNVLTIDEDLNTDDDNNPFTNPLDSDNDTTPDYLDADDDGDGVNTRDEENFLQDEDPTNDETNPGEGPDYLNPLIFTTVPATAFRAHSAIRNYTISIKLTNISLSALTQDEFDFGSMNQLDTIILTPLFN